MANRITAAIAAIDTLLAEGIPDERLAAIEEVATLDVADWVQLGEFPTRAYMAGVFTLDEANVLHDIHTRFRGTASLAERVTFVQVVAAAGPTVMGVAA